MLIYLHTRERNDAKQHRETNQRRWLSKRKTKRPVLKYKIKRVRFSYNQSQRICICSCAMKQYCRKRKCGNQRPTVHLVNGNRYHVDSGIDYTYASFYRIAVLDNGSKSAPILGGLTNLTWERWQRLQTFGNTDNPTWTVRKTKS